MNTLRALLVSASIVSLGVIGEITTTEISQVMGPWIRDLGVVGVLVWYLWFQCSKVQPRHEAEMSTLARENREEMALLAREFHAAIVKMTDNCRYVRDDRETTRNPL